MVYLVVVIMHLVPRMATALVFFICVSNDGSEQANAQYYSTGINSREMRMCGPMLTNTLELVCQGRFNTINKKAQDAGARSRDWADNDRENFAIFPFRSRRNALSFNAANAFRRRTRNVVDECCHVKSCTIAEMKHYCERN
ncbi:hypothetical protein RUM44_007566 [Polyplax serrata]|uniref:Insulin-like domain-containing protein n=1 Tax=Polyplax serrata TaxID=468196 RepID=A0ABR1B6Z7_POLSC